MKTDEKGWPLDKDGRRMRLADVPGHPMVADLVEKHISGSGGAPRVLREEDRARCVRMSYEEVRAEIKKRPILAMPSTTCAAPPRFIGALPGGADGAHSPPRPSAPPAVVAWVDRQIQAGAWPKGQRGELLKLREERPKAAALAVKILQKVNEPAAALPGGVSASDRTAIRTAAARIMGRANADLAQQTRRPPARPEPKTTPQDRAGVKAYARSFWSR